MDALVVSILTGLARAGLAAAGGYMVSKGWVDGSTATSWAGYAGVAAAGAWSWFNKIVMHKEVKEAAATGVVKK